MATEVTRDVRHPVKLLLWGRAAGRCEFQNCNKPLSRSPVTQEQVNIGEKGHIYSVSPNGPRGNDGIPPDEINDLSNLLLVCHDCHKLMDDDSDGRTYSTELLKEMKETHEERIELMTAIGLPAKSHVLLYGANIGSYSSSLSFTLAQQALVPERRPAESRPIQLGMINSSRQDSEVAFWQVEQDQLIKMFDRNVRARLKDGDIEHLSVFALAPQPLLVLLGSLMGDIADVEVYQLHREPKGWRWLEDCGPIELSVEEPQEVTGAPALVLSVSATITDHRIHQVLGDSVSLWKVTIRAPNNDCLRCRNQLREFRQCVRPLMDRIKERHGEGVQLHVFPALPVAMAVELGRIRQEKAALSWRIYDQVNHRGGFVPAITIMREENHG